MSLNRVNKDEV